MATKTYKISYKDLYWEAKVKIDDSVVIDHLSEPGRPYDINNIMLSMITFWMGGEERLKSNDGDVTQTFLQQLGKEILYVHLKNNYNTLGVREEFSEMEGWTPMDGSWGIEILYCEDTDFRNEDFIVTEANHA